MTAKLAALVLYQWFCLINYVLVTVRHYCVREREKEGLRFVRSFFTRCRKLGEGGGVFGVRDNKQQQQQIYNLLLLLFLFGWVELMNRERRNVGR